MVLFCAAIRRDSVSLLKFPFLSHVHLFSREMSLVSRLKRTFAILLRLIYSHFDIIGSYGVDLCCY